MVDLDIFNDAPSEGAFSILTVCTGNICRSPLAESIFRLVLQRLPVTVSSAGTHALIDAPMTEQNQAIAQDLGVLDSEQHRARQLVEGHVRDADLVLALSREHRRTVVEMLPKASRTSFTLREFARLADALSATNAGFSQYADPGARMRAAVAAVAQMRGAVESPADPAEDDVVDPYRQSDEVYAQSAEQLIPAVNAAAALLRRAAQNGGA